MINDAGKRRVKVADYVAAESREVAFLPQQVSSASRLWP